MNIPSRLLNLTIPSLNDRTLVLTHFQSDEALSQPFTLNIDFLTANATLHPSDLLGKTASITIHAQGQQQPFHGVITDAALHPMGKDGLRAGQATLKPWFAVLDVADTRACQIYQGKTVPQIATDVFKQYGATDYDLSLLHKTYVPRPYCCRYNETAFAFVARILAEAGIYYSFTHHAHKHVLVLHDNGFATQHYPRAMVCRYPAERLPDLPVMLTQWTRHECLVPHRFTRLMHDPITNRIYTRSIKIPSDTPATPTFEQYAYPMPAPDADPSTLDDQAKRDVGAADTLRETVIAQGNYLGLSPGMAFTLSQHTRACELGRYLLTGLKTVAYDQSQRDPNTAHYHNEMTAQPARVPYVPTSGPTKPELNGHQIATVVGPKGKSVYTDALGRIKVQFPWNTTDAFNEHSSCWLRVRQPWLGNRMGIQVIPRIGQQVAVIFLQGDPDQPLVFGPLNHEDHLPPFAPEHTPERSGIRTQTLDGEGHQVLRFDDTPGQENLLMRAQKNMQVAIAGHQHIEIQGNHKTTLQAGDYQATVEGKLTLEAAERVRFASENSHLTIDNDAITISADTLTMEQKESN